MAKKNNDDKFYTCLELFSLEKKLSDMEIMIFKSYITFSNSEEQTYHSIPDVVFKSILRSNNINTADVTMRFNYINLFSLLNKYMENPNQVSFKVDRKEIHFSMKTKTKFQIIMKENDRQLVGTIDSIDYVSFFRILKMLSENIPSYVLSHIQLNDIRTISMRTKKILGVAITSQQNEPQVIPEVVENIQKQSEVVKNGMEYIDENPPKPPETSIIKEPSVSIVEEPLKSQKPLQSEFTSFNDDKINLNFTRNYDDFKKFISGIITTNQGNMMNHIINTFNLNSVNYFTTTPIKYKETLNNGIWKYYNKCVKKTPTRQKKMFMYKIEPTEIDSNIESLTVLFVKHEIQSLMTNDMDSVGLLETVFAPFWMSYLPYIKTETLDGALNCGLLTNMEKDTILKLQSMTMKIMSKFPNYYNDMVSYLKTFIEENMQNDIEQNDKEINQMDVAEQYL